VVGKLVPVKIVDGQHFIRFAAREKVGLVVYNPSAIQRLILLEYCVIIREEVELDGHSEEKTVDLR